MAAISRGHGSTILGIGNAEWPAEDVELPPDWTILLYTDGIIEGRVGDGAKRLGESGLHRLLAERILITPDWRGQPEEMLSDLIADAESLNGGALSDDVAMLLLGVRGGST